MFPGSHTKMTSKLAWLVAIAFGQAQAIVPLRHHVSSTRLNMDNVYVDYHNKYPGEPAPAQWYVGILYPNVACDICLSKLLN